MKNIKLSINGNEHQVKENISIQEILDYLGTTSKMIVVEVNREIIPKEKYSDFIAKEGDEIEIVSFFGGG